ncbi:hypothetical protein [Arthrobacter sp. KK5.5]|uniref:hypothetical protein n=1 Tax=Arthrobacter sp. KK5.5 TaxID=3373084 RepID=UPI003EE817B2
MTPHRTVKIATTTGVAYYVNSIRKTAGTHTYTGTGTVTAKASTSSYMLAGTVSWKFDNRNAVTPTPRIVQMGESSNPGRR